MTTQARQLSTLSAASSGEVREEIVGGTTYLVAPVVAVMESVLHGQLLPGEEITEFGWNGVPLPIGHPRVNGQPVTVNSPDQMANTVGRFFNAKKDGNRLTGELWVEVNKAQTHSPEARAILTKLRSGERVEVSTGYFHDVEYGVGAFNGKDYSGVQRNLTPDHLALLPPGTLGECDWAQGCGAPRINEAGGCPCTREGGVMDTKIMSLLKKFLPNEVFPVEDEPASPSLMAAGLAVVADDTGRVLMLQRFLDETDPAAGTWEFPGGRLEPEEAPLVAAVREWQEEVGHVLDVDAEPTGEWISSNGVYQGFVVHVPSEDAVHLRDDRGVVGNPDDPDLDHIEAIAWWDPDQLLDNPALRAELSEDISTVRVVIGNMVNSPSDGAEEGKGLMADKTDPAEAPPEDEKETTVQEEDEELEEELEEDEKPAANARKRRKQVQVNNELTEEQWLERAPARIREVVMSAMEREEQERESLIQVITANEAPFSREELEGKSTDELNKLSQMARRSAAPTYVGRGGPRTNAATDEVLTAPRLFTANKKEAS